MSARVVRPERGARFDAAGGHARAVGRIGGATGLIPADALARLVAALGPRATWLPASGAPPAGPRFVADFDGCSVDGAQIAGIGALERVVRDGRVADIEGAFVIAWRDDAGSLLLARDALGHRSLFYARVPGGTIFASRVPALLATGLVPRVVDPTALATYLSCAYVPGSATLVQGVSALLPGHVLRIDAAGRAEETPFWSPPDDGVVRPATDEDLLRLELREALEIAVRARMPDGEVAGATLSGGVDSSLVVALAARLTGPGLRTYSISWGEGHANELPWSSMVAAHCATDHTIVELSAGVVIHHLDDTVALLDKPNGDPLTVPNALVFREAARDVTAVFNGEGGDPCFGGPKNTPMLLAELLGDGDDDADDRPGKRERSFLRAHQKCFDDLGKMLAPAVRAAIPEGGLEASVTPFFASDRWRSFITKLMVLNVVFKTAHHILPKVDALSAPFGARPLSPLLDRRVVELSFAIPPQLKLRGSEEKYLLKQAVRDLLPAPILDRPKSGMLVPVEGWFSGPLLPEARARLLDGLARHDVIDRRWMEALLAGKVGGSKPRRGAKIWLLLTLEAWLRGVLRA